MKTYSIFGTGAAGLYTAWRLLNGKAKNEKGKAKMLVKGDVLELYDWGKYDFSKKEQGTRAPGARICTWHYKDDQTNSYLELGGMRYAEYDKKTGGHLLVTTVIQQLGLDKYSRIFNEATDQLLYLRNRNLYLSEIGPGNPAPYNIPMDGANQSPYNGFNTVQNLADTKGLDRKGWCEFQQNGKLKNLKGKESVYQNGELVKNIGYWNLMYDQLDSEGYSYTADANGYTSNVINWNSAVAFNSNNEFTPGNQYKTLTHGYSSMFTALFAEIEKLAKEKGIVFNYFPDTRLHSILNKKEKVHFTVATRANPWKPAGEKTCDAAWMAMPRAAIESVAEATRYRNTDGLDVLNDTRVRLYLEAAVMQPSYKIGLFFDTPWWENATYAPKLSSYSVNAATLNLKWLKPYSTPIKADADLYTVVFDTSESLIKALEACIRKTLTGEQTVELIAQTKMPDTIGPSFTDMPVRMAVYFGNNALDQQGKKVYGMLASYDDEYFTSFWRELEENPGKEWLIPEADDVQPLEGPRKAPSAMVKMLRKQLAAMHFGPGTSFEKVPEPLEARYMDWSLPPFNAGYHAWAAHYDVCDVQQKIRKPSQLIKGADANIFIVGEAYSNDQAWVEGAYCTSESVLNDFFDMEPIVDVKDYPFICSCK
ncbi:MAG TPA: hypothetical protein VNZ86_20755 [Bacteroidia bacterium]|jgi:hypothetical protein|nr:hypothetical protein [Bacteroidia bacterium]